MELKQFIKIALADITNAIHESQQELNNGAVINPKRNILENNSITSDEIHFVKFDVNVMVTENNKSGKSFGASLNVFTTKIGDERLQELNTTSRLSFSIPVYYPGGNFPL